jgi:hypothetical protein
MRRTSSRRRRRRTTQPGVAEGAPRVRPGYDPTAPHPLRIDPEGVARHSPGRHGAPRRAAVDAPGGRAPPGSRIPPGPMRPRRGRDEEGEGSGCGPSRPGVRLRRPRLRSATPPGSIDAHRPAMTGVMILVAAVIPRPDRQPRDTPDLSDHQSRGVRSFARAARRGRDRPLLL